MTKTTNKYLQRVRKRAVRMVLNGEVLHQSCWAAMLRPRGPQ